LFFTPHLSAPSPIARPCHTHPKRWERRTALGTKWRQQNSQAIVKNTHAARKNLHVSSPAHCLRQKTVVVREIFVVRSVSHVAHRKIRFDWRKTLTPPRSHARA